MAASGYTPIITYNSTTTGHTPTTITTGELAVNITDGILFVGTGTNTYNTLVASKGTTAITTLGTVTTGTWNATTIATGYGGTGLTSFTSGGAVYATSTSALTTGTLPTTAGGTGVANNVASTITISGNYASTFVVSGAYSYTFPPATDTLVNLGSSQTLANKTLTNPTVTNYVETLYAPSAGSSFSISLANGTIQEITLNANGTITLPSSTAGKSFTIIVTYSGSYSLTWAGGSTLKWAGGTTPTATSTSGKYDIFNFYQDGTNTYGSVFGLSY